MFTNISDASCLRTALNSKLEERKASTFHFEVRSDSEKSQVSTSCGYTSPVRAASSYIRAANCARRENSNVKEVLESEKAQLTPSLILMYCRVLMSMPEMEIEESEEDDKRKKESSTTDRP
uniref:Uncharacterized protein n=1 Tax=Pristionchus pacificus TaxID=54126 RepID=A0A2A6B7J3_PRIPA|eukprot:PDM61850.1 hypothetical protein PRIPAC_51292 [Pristionchus pacificus]